MTENKRTIATDLKRLDAHVVAPAEYEDAPELTDEQLATADVFDGRKLIRRGRPRSLKRKQAVKIRLDPEIVDYFRGGGPGWQTRLNAMLLKVVWQQLKRVKSKQAKAGVRKAQPKTKTPRLAATRKQRAIHGGVQRHH
jgi:uncharacterized protein (DUF4415 family)